jgi:UDP-glucose 4-epimerase
MKIFVTGSSGFIGGYLLPILSKVHRVHQMHSDLLDFKSVELEIEHFNPDLVIHLAARTEVEKSFYEQTTFSQINYVGSVNLIESAAKCSNLKSFLFASTMEVYGWQPISDIIQKNGTVTEFEAFDENTKPNPNAPYSVAKYGVEKYLEYMHRTRNFPFAALRQTNTYGRKDNDFFVTEQIITQMLKNPDEINLGYKDPYRNFIYIDDLINAWLTLIEQHETVSTGKIFTVGPDNPIRIEDYANLIAAKLNWQGKINWNTKPKRPGEIYYLNSNHNLITSITGWQPVTSLSEGLDKTISYWKNK